MPHPALACAYQRCKSLVGLGRAMSQAMIDSGYRDARFLTLPRFDAPTDSLAEISEKAERLCAEIAPELGRPYVVAQSTLLAEFQSVGVCGWTGPQLGAYLQDSIGDRWRGDRPAVIFNDTKCRQCAMDIVDESDQRFPSLFVNCVLEIVIHELAHLVSYTRPFVRATSVDNVPRERAKAIACIAAVSQNGSEFRIPFKGHGPCFTRCAAHTYYRAQRLDVVTEFSFAGEPYAMSSPDSYARTLADEVSDMRDATFEEIRATPYPPQFVKLWYRDFFAWCKSLGDGVDSSALIANDWLIPQHLDMQFASRSVSVPA